MIEFLKNIIKKTNFKSENENLNKYNKIIYSIILFCAVCFIGFIVYCVIIGFPDFAEHVKEAWNNSKSVLNGFHK